MTTGASLTKVAIDEYGKFIKHAELLIFKDSLTADNAETTESAIRGNIYTSAKLGLLFDDNGEPVPEADRERIILNYEEGTKAIYEALKAGLPDTEVPYEKGELNPYYRDLYCEKGVDITTARLASDFEIIYESNLKLIESFRQLFRSEYTANLVYFKKVLFTHGFGNDSKGYRSFVRFFVAWMTIESSINKVKGPPALNIELMDEWAVRNMMYSFGVYFLDDLSLAHQKTILINLMELLRNKGSDRVFTTILSIFGFQDIEAFRYYLIKDYDFKEDKVTKDFSKPDAFFMKVPYEEENFEDFLNTMSTQEREALKRNYHTVTGSDSTWKVTKDEVLNMEFNAIQTKYFDIQSAMEVMKISTQMALFSNMMRTIRKDRHFDDQMYFVSVEVIEAPISVFDALIALNILATEILGYEARIPKSESELRTVWNFQNSEDYNGMSVKYRSEFESGSFVGAHDIPGMLDYRNVVPAFEGNIEIKDRMEVLMSAETDYDTYRNLQDDYNILFMSKQMDDVFAGFDTYLEYIQSRNENLYDFLKSHIDDISEEEDHRQVLRKAFNAIAVSLENYVNSDKFRPTSFNTDYILTFVKRMINTFKAYTVQLNDISIYYKIDGPIHTIKLFDVIRGWDAKFGKAGRVLLVDNASEKTSSFDQIDGWDLAELVKILSSFTHKEDFLDYLVEVVRISSKFGVADLLRIQQELRILGKFGQIDGIDLYAELMAHTRMRESLSVRPVAETNEQYFRSLAESARSTIAERIDHFSGLMVSDKPEYKDKSHSKSIFDLSDTLSYQEHVDFTILGVDEVLLLRHTQSYVNENQITLIFNFPKHEKVVLTLEHFFLSNPLVNVNGQDVEFSGAEVGSRYKTTKYDIELIPGENRIIIDKSYGYDLRLIQITAFRGDGSLEGFIEDDTLNRPPVEPLPDEDNPDGYTEGVQLETGEIQLNHSEVVEEPFTTIPEDGVILNFT